MSDYLYDRQDPPQAGEPGLDGEVQQLEQLLGSFSHHQSLRRPLAPQVHASTPRHSLVGPRPMALLVAVAAVMSALLLRPRPPVRPPIFDQGATVLPPSTARPSQPNTDGRSCMRPEELTEPPDPHRSISVPSDFVTLDLGSSCHLRRSNSSPGWAPLEDEPGSRGHCEYWMTLVDGRDIHLSVVSGAVTLRFDELTVWVPAGHRLWLVSGSGPQLPMRRDASAKLQDLVARFDRGDTSVVEALLSEVRPSDRGTLWNLLPRTRGSQARRVRKRITELHAQGGSLHRAMLEGLPYPEDHD